MEKNNSGEQRDPLGNLAITLVPDDLLLPVVL
ncbi:MAG: hypothetical protein CG437_425, partial [Methanosaeta sp. NSP1]